ncbi:MAG TPA: hypothetical protein EYQ27_20565, partial [Gemmatimonadetes bacterium]|nr:hypothetical protein [Gemmatimonadota bacterium]
LVNDETVDAVHDTFLRETFTEQIAPHLEPMPLTGGDTPPFLKNHRVYLAAEVWEGSDTSWVPSYHLVEVPTDFVPRFFTLPPRGEVHEVMFLDDIIRYNLDQVFPGEEVGHSYALKLTRDAELYVDDEFEVDLVDAIRLSLGKRDTGLPSRFLYDMRMPYVLIHRLQHELRLAEEDLVLGARYHNLSGLPEVRPIRPHLPGVATPTPPDTRDRSVALGVGGHCGSGNPHAVPIVRPLRTLLGRGRRGPGRSGDGADRVPCRP